MFIGVHVYITILKIFPVMLLVQGIYIALSKKILSRQSIRCSFTEEPTAISEGDITKKKEYSVDEE